MYNITNIWMWLGFFVFLIIALNVNLLLSRKKYARPHDSMRAAFIWTGVWVACALIFNGILWVYVYFSAGIHHANEKGISFLTGYLIEESLSLDNLFAFYIIFHQFRIPVHLQHRVFNYGIWSAVVLRLTLILVGSWMVTHFHWVLYLMGVFLLLTGIKMFFAPEVAPDLNERRIMKWLKRHIRITPTLENENFFVRKNNLLYATPLFITLIFIELTDVVFAFDSIPAIFAITTDPYIVWTSNIFAILGLRALYFVVSNMVNRFDLLKFGIALILVFVGFKMVVAPWLKISAGVSLGVIATILIVFSLISFLKQRRAKRKL